MPYSTAAIRQLLNTALDDEELKVLCFDYFRTVYDKFALETSRSQKIHILIEYCTRTEQLEELLNQVREINPVQYDRFIPSIAKESPASAKKVNISPETEKAVKYRDTIKLRHLVTRYTLHSHTLTYTHPDTSGQQQVTAFAGSDANDYWIVKGPHGQPEFYKEGQPVIHGDIIRLEHVRTRKNLHSHGYIRSPISAQQEVTAYGENGIGDANDNWQVEVEQGGVWYDQKRIKLIHVNTQHALHSHAGAFHPEFTAGQQEVTCFGARDDNDWWYIDR